MIKKTFDLVIVNYNSTDATIECIKSIKLNTNNISINAIIVDNASIDNPQRIRLIFPEVTLLLNKSNVGYSKAINQALQFCQSPYLTILNPDTIILNGFFSEVHKYLNNNPTIGIVGPEILDPDGSIQGSARRFPTIRTSFFGRKSPITRLFPNNMVTKKEFFCFNYHGYKQIDVDWVSGACMVIRKEAIDKIGGFDENFFLYWEDADLCKRIMDAGWRIVYYRNAKITHLVGKSSSSKPIASICHFHISSYKYYEKHSSGMQKLFVPLVFFGLSARCIIVVTLNLFGRFLNLLKNKIKKHSKTHAINNLHNQIDRKIKVLRFVSRLNIGGPSIHVSILSKNLNQKKFESILIYGSISPKEGDMRYVLNGISSKIIRFRYLPELQREINPFKDCIALLKIFFIIVHEKPDIIHTHLAKAGALARFSAILINQFRHHKIKIVHTYHGHVLQGYFGKLKSNIYKLIEKSLGKYTDRIIAISQTQQYELTEKYKIASNNKIQIINLGFDFSKFTGKKLTDRNVRKKIRATDNEKIIAIIGRLTPIKNHRLFLDAAKILKGRNIGCQLKFLIVGDGELRIDLEKYVEYIGIVDDVIFYGWEKEIEKIYSMINILGLTSINEGTPVSIIEAMVSEIPVITTGVGGVKDLLGDISSEYKNKYDFKVCERGILCLQNDPEIFANGLEYMLSDQFLKNKEIIKSAKEYVLANYSHQRLINDIGNLYLNLIKNT